MLLLAALALALLWGLLRGGNPLRLQSLVLRHSGLAFAAFTIQAALIFLPISKTYGDPARVWAMVLSLALLGGFVWANRKLPGMWLLGLGLFANGLVIIVNGGYMPVTYEALNAAGMSRLVDSTTTGTVVMGSKDVLLPFAETRLGFLSDIFVLPPPFPINGVFSVGDVLIALGIFWFVPFAFGANRDASSKTTPAL